MVSVNRREFLRGVAGLSSAAALLRDPDRSGIEHIVVLMMENRSFDHLLGWLPGANGRQAGLHFPGPDGAMHPTFAAGFPISDTSAGMRASEKMR